MEDDRDLEKAWRSLMRDARKVGNQETEKETLCGKSGEEIEVPTLAVRILEKSLSITSNDSPEVTHLRGMLRDVVLFMEEHL